MDIEEIKDFIYEVRTFGITSNDAKFVKITEYLLAELEKEKEKNKELTERVLRLESDKFWDNVVSKDKIKKVIDEESFEVHTREYGTLYVVSSDRLEEELEE